jgi:hypothetical protein
MLIVSELQQTQIRAYINMPMWFTAMQIQQIIVA